MTQKLFIASFLFLTLGMMTAHAGTAVPKLEQRVTDMTNTLSFQEWQVLERTLKSFEDTTSDQIVILMVQSLQGEDIEGYSYNVFKENHIGEAKKNNGILLVIAKDDHKMKIETGYGMEGVLTDAVCSKIMRNEITPQFREGNYFAGLIAGTDAMMRAAAGEYHADETDHKKPFAGGSALIFILIGAFYVLSMVASRRRHIIGSRGPFYYSGWGGGFGGGSGGFGGGGGWSGGGGMSGGGGATGSW